MPRGKAKKLIRKFKISWFKPKNMSKGAITVILAKKNMGKSFLTLDLMHQLRKRFNHGIIVTQTAGTTKNGYGEHISDVFMHSKFDDDELMEILNEKQKALEELRELKKTHPEMVTMTDEEIEREWFVILDDCMDDKAVKNSQFLKSIGLRGRHANCFCIIITNSAKQISKELREAADYLMLFQPQGTTAADEISKEYCPVGFEIYEFKNLLETLTQNKGVLVVNKPANANKTKEDDVESGKDKSIQYYRASDAHTKEKWFMGGKNFTRFGKQYRKKVKVGSSIALMNFNYGGENNKDNGKGNKSNSPEDNISSAKTRKENEEVRMSENVLVVKEDSEKSKPSTTQNKPQKPKVPEKRKATLELPSPDCEDPELKMHARKRSKSSSSSSSSSESGVKRKHTNRKEAEKKPESSAKRIKMEKTDIMESIPEEDLQEEEDEDEEDADSQEDANNEAEGDEDGEVEEDEEGDDEEGDDEEGGDEDSSSSSRKRPMIVKPNNKNQVGHLSFNIKPNNPTTQSKRFSTPSISFM